MVDFELWFQIIQTTQNTLAEIQERLDRQYDQAAEDLGMTKEEFIERCASICQSELAEVETL
jgi:hypothetical protein